MLLLSPEQLYSEREARFQAAADAEARRSRAYSRARLGVFLAGAASLVTGLARGGDVRLPLLTVTALAAAVFVALVIRHDRVEDRRQQHANLAGINRAQRARASREWGAIPPIDVQPAPETHPYALDLDLFGRASVLRWLGAVGTPDGAQTLRDWLLQPADTASLLGRQQAVAELAPLLDLRQELLARASEAVRGRGGVHAAGFTHFLEWAAGTPWLITRPWLLWLARVFGAAAAVLALLHATAVITEPLWLLPATVNVIVWFLLVRRIEHSFNRAFARDAAPGREALMFEVVERQAFAAPVLRELHDRAKGACAAMRRLQLLMELADIRLTPLIHFPLNALTLWDFHVLAAVERWQQTFGRRIRDWFAAVGEVEALSAFAGIRHDNPGWAVPEFTSDPILEARALGHPLLPDRTRVANDVMVGPPATFLFVTGSNMSGKSTLLRAIGVNVVLAQAGAPVCATALRLPSLSVSTSIRVQDSLEEGVSYFMAALQRLKGILSEAKHPPDGRILLYLLDEVLQGTNTAERQIAVRTIIGQLLTSTAIGAITSHDLNLADEEPLASAASAVHFEEHFDGATMTFDYRLRPGVATSRNALKLMNLIGIQESS